MKHNRWFIWFVFVLIVLNLSIFVLLRYLHGVDFFKRKFTTILSTSLNAEVKVGSFSISEKQLFISNLEIYDKKKIYQLKARHIYINYNLLRIIGAQFKVGQLLNEIRIYDPVIVYHYQKSPKKKSGPSETPDFSKWFKKLDIENGTITLNYKDDLFGFSEKADSIHISIENQKKTHLQISAFVRKTGKFDLDATFSKNRILSLNTELNNLPFHNLNLKGYGNLTTTLNAIYKQNNHFSYYALKTDSILFVPDKDFKKWINSSWLVIDDFKLSGNQSQAEFLLTIRNNQDLNGKLKGMIQDPFKKQNLNAVYEITNLRSPETIKDLKTTINLKGDLHYFNQKLGLNCQITSDSLLYFANKFSDIDLQVKTEDLFKKDLNYLFKNVKGLNGLISSEGYYNLKKNQLKMNVRADSVQYSYNDLKVKGNIVSGITLNKSKPAVNVDFTGLSASYNQYSLKNLSGNIRYNSSDFSLNLKDQSKTIKLESSGNLDKKLFQAEINTHSLPLKTISPDLPDILLNSEISIDKDKNDLVSQLYLYIPSETSTGLKIKTKGVFKADLNKQKSSLDLKIYDSQFNQAPIDITLKAQGTLDYLKTDQFSINNVIQARVEAGIKPKLYYVFNVSGSQIGLNQFTRYFFDEAQTREMKGMVSLNTSYNSNIPGSLQSSLSIRQFSLEPLNPSDLLINLSGDPENIRIDRIDLVSRMDKIFSAKGSIRDLGADISLDGSYQSDLLEMIKDAKIKGLIKGDFSLKINPENKYLTFDLNGNNLEYNKMQISDIELNLEQTNKLLVLNKLKIQNNSYLNINASGSLDYNFLEDQIYPGNHQINMNIESNPLKYLSLQNDYILSGDSDITGKLSLIMTDDGLLFNKGNITLNDGYLKIRGQQESIKNMDIDLSISDNLITFNKFSLMMGKGVLNFRNQITQSDEDFILGPLNMGILYFKTNKEGLLFHFPYYMPNNSVANCVITGRKSDEAVIKGPFDNMSIQGDVFFSNGSAVYPSDTENLLKFIQFIREESDTEDTTEEDEDSWLPFTLDLIMHFNENIRYVTYPLNLQVNDSYLWLTYKEGDWSAYEAEFNSDSGSLELFGTVFKAEKVNVKITPFETYPYINGRFYNKAPDGTTITLDIVANNTNNKNFYESLQFNLKSDNADDKTAAQILAKLRYGKSLDELSSQQEESLLQDEAIQLVGVGLGSAFIDPYISPIENKIRRALRLDTFTLNPGFVQNLFNEYKTNDNNQVKDKYSQNEVVNFSSSILLDNLTINMGKYVSRNLFVNYEALFQEETDLEEKTNIFMYNNLSLRYDLPYKFKLTYEFQVIPAQRKDTHQIMLMRAFKF